MFLSRFRQSPYFDYLRKINLDMKLFKELYNQIYHGNKVTMAIWIKPVLKWFAVSHNL